MFGKSKVNRFRDGEFTTPGPGHYNSAKDLAEEAKGIAGTALRSKTARFSKENAPGSCELDAGAMGSQSKSLRTRHNSESSLLLSAEKEKAQMKMSLTDEINMRKTAIELEEAKRKVAILEKENCYLSKKAEMLTQEKDGLLKGEREARKRCERESSKLKKIQKEFDSVADSISKIEELRKRKKSAENELEGVKEELMASKTAVAFLTKKIEENSESQREMQEADQNMINSLTSNLGTIKNQAEETKLQLEQKLRSQEETLKNALSQEDHLKKQIETLQLSLESYRLKMEPLLEDSEAKVSGLESQVASFENQASEFEAAYRETVCADDAAMGSLGFALEQTSKCLREREEELAATAEQFREDLCKKNAKTNALQKELQDANDQNTGLSNELLELYAKYSELHKQGEEVKEANAKALEQEAAKQEAAALVYHERIDSLQKSRTECQLECLFLEGKNHDLETDNTDKTIEIQNLRNDLWEMKLLLAEKCHALENVEHENTLLRFVTMENANDAEIERVQSAERYKQMVDVNTQMISNQLKSAAFNFEEYREDSQWKAYHRMMEADSLNTELLHALQNLVRAKQDQQAEHSMHSKKMEITKKLISSLRVKVEEGEQQIKDKEDDLQSTASKLQAQTRELNSRNVSLEDQMHQLDWAFVKEKEKNMELVEELWETRFLMDEKCRNLQLDLAQKTAQHAVAEGNCWDVEEGFRQLQKVFNEVNDAYSDILTARTHGNDIITEEFETESFWLQLSHKIEMEELKSQLQRFLKLGIISRKELEEATSMRISTNEGLQKVISELKMEVDIYKEKVKETEHHFDQKLKDLKATLCRLENEKQVLQDSNKALVSNFEGEQKKVCRLSEDVAKHKQQAQKICDELTENHVHEMELVQERTAHIEQQKKCAEERNSALSTEIDRLTALAAGYEEREKEIKDMKQKLMQFANVEVDLQSTLEAGERAQLESRLAQKALENLIAENAMLAGHQNAKQKIKHLQSVKQKNIELEKRAGILEAQVKKLKSQVDGKCALSLTVPARTLGTQSGRPRIPTPTSSLTGLRVPRNDQENFMVEGNKRMVKKHSDSNIDYNINEKKCQFGNDSNKDNEKSFQMLL